MSEVNKGRVGLLVAALRSGLYKKGRSALHEVPIGDREPFAGTWCCLGVAGDVARRFGLEFESSFDGTHEEGTNSSTLGCELEVLDGNDSYMTQKVADWYGFPTRSASNSNPSDITSLDVRVYDESGYMRAASVWNDLSSTTFEDIADGFERTFIKEGK